MTHRCRQTARPVVHRRPASLGEPEIVVAGDRRGGLRRRRDAHRRRRSTQAIAEHGRAHFVTTGGSTPVGIYRLLSERLRGALDWRRVHFWWGDDRFVPRDHPLSNVHGRRLDPASAVAAVRRPVEQPQLPAPTSRRARSRASSSPSSNVHPIPCGEAIARSEGTGLGRAARTTDELQAADLPVERGFPVVRPHPARASARTATSCRSSRAATPSIAPSWALRRPGARRTSSRMSRG